MHFKINTIYQLYTFITVLIIFKISLVRSASLPVNSTEEITTSPSSNRSLSDAGKSSFSFYNILKSLSNSESAIKLGVFNDPETDDTVIKIKLVDPKNPEALSEIDEGNNEVAETGTETGRTINRIRRRRMRFLLLLPLSFKLGVIVTLLSVVTTVTMNSLGLGLIMLLLLLTNKQYTGKLFGSQRTAPNPAAELAESTKNLHIYMNTLPPPEYQQVNYEPWQAIGQSHAPSSTYQ